MASEFVPRITAVVEQMKLDMRKRWWWWVIVPILTVAYWVFQDWVVAAVKGAFSAVSAGSLRTFDASVSRGLVHAVSVMVGSFLIVLLGFFVHAYFETRPTRRLRARFTNARVFPNIHKATMLDVLETDRRSPGWDKRTIGWEWFMEIHVVNGSRPVTVEEVEVEVTLDGQKRQAKVLDDLGDYLIDMAMDANANFQQFSGGQRYKPVVSLKEKLSGVPLAEGVGYRGWVHVDVDRMAQADIGRSQLNVWLIDAFGKRHEVDLDREEEKKWNQSFLIFKQTR